MKRVRSKVTKTTERFELSGEELLELIRAKHDLGAGEVRMFVTVPHGGDYSGEQLDLLSPSPDVTLELVVVTETTE